MLYSNTICSKVESGVVVTSGTFASLISPASPFKEGFPEDRAKADFGVYPISAAPTPSAIQTVEATAPYYDANTDKVFEHQLRSKTLTERKADKATAIKRKAAALVAAGFTYAIPGQGPLDPHTYAILDDDQANMLAVQVRFAKGGTNHHGGFWRCTSNHNVTMSDAEVQAFFDAAYAYKMGIIRNAVVLSDAVRTAANVSALNLIDVDAGTNDSSGGWPSNGS